MKAIIFFFFIFNLCSLLYSHNLCYSQLQQDSSAFSFTMAENYIQKQDTSKALWVYINLFPSDSVKVIEAVWPLLSEKQSIKKEIFTSFGINWMSDKSIFDGNGGVNAAEMKRKGNWADRLIAALEKRKASKK